MINKSLFLFSVLCMLFFSAPQTAFASTTQNYDVVIIGAGSGGCAAAIQAARMGVSVALVEQSDWIGGQMTGAAVSTMDDKTKTRTGIYLEFINKVREYYAGLNTNVNVCYWGSDTIAFEPWVGQKILRDMAEGAGLLDIYLEANIKSVKVFENKVISALFDIKGTPVTFTGKVFIDATECGDFIPLTGARYRAGNSISPNINKEGIIQDITYPAVVRYYPGGLPSELRIKKQPPRYIEYLYHFIKTIRKDGSTWPGEYPFNVPTHNAYRAMPDTSNKMLIDGGRPETWPYITRTAINWANDYPGNENGDPGLSVEFLENHEFRKKAEREAMVKTLAFLYYMQTELGMSNWSVDNKQGYGGWFSNDWRNWEDLSAEYAPIFSYFPPFPYVRESRRLVGLKTMTIDDIVRDDALGRTLKNIPDSLALGEYPIDIHGNHDNKYLEADLGETRDKIPNNWTGNGGLFQIPFGVFIPEKIDGLLAAEKNISVSRVVNGSTRLQPVTMLTGQAAGAIAALAVKHRTQPRHLRPIDIQAELWNSKTQLSLRKFEDVPQYAVPWAGVEAAMLYDYMDPVTENVFGIYNDVYWIDVRDAFRRAFGIKKFPARRGDELVAVNDFAAWLKELYKNDLKRYEGIIDDLSGEKPLNKGKLALTVLNIMKTAPAAEKKAEEK